MTNEMECCYGCDSFADDDSVCGACLKDREPLKTYEVVTVAKVTDMSRHTVDGNANYILWSNSFRALGTPAGTDDAGDVVGYLWDNAYEAGKSLHFF